MALVVVAALLLVAGAGRPAHHAPAARPAKAGQVQQRLEVLKAALPLSREEVIRRYLGKDDWLVLDLVHHRYRVEVQLALSLTPGQTKQLFDTGRVHLEAAQLTPAQRALAERLAKPLGWITFLGPDRGLLEFQWSPDHATVRGAGPPTGEFLHDTIIDLSRGLTPREQASLNDVVRSEREE